ncbi:hypothetical protein GmHk_07G020254 [Glycine max]|nr:hypothetical protein GmHk_07G020254 [Glycine max]
MRFDVVGRMDLSSLQKCIVTICIVAYGSPADCVDEYIRIGECTTTQCLQKFARGVNEIFGQKYLRRPNNNDINCLLRIEDARGFLVASSNNDINVLNQSPVFDDVLQGRAPPVQFTINETPYNMGYYLAYGIYPDWPTFVKIIPMLQGPKRKLFTKCQEATRKDVERAFGVFKSRFAIICGLSRAWNIDTMKDIMLTCIILHNMIVEDERDTFNNNVDVDYDHVENEISNIEIYHTTSRDFATYLQRRCIMHTRGIH